MFRFLRFAAVAAIASGVLAIPFFMSRAGSGIHAVSVIVELRDDPGAVYAAKSKQKGSALSNDQIQAYRKGLSATQDQFLAALKSKGIDAQLQTINVRDAAGNVAGSVQIRYSLVYNGLALTVPDAAVPAIASMSQVKTVHANAVLQPNLIKSVPYIRANEVYGHNPNNFTPFANSPDGDEGQGINIAVIDTGIDWTHPMFGGDVTPPRLGVAPAAAAVNTNQKVIYSLPLADIITDGFGHGTHVASETAGYLAMAPGPDGIPGTTDDIPLHGVAPQAKLMSYKVCSDVESTVSQVQNIGGCSSSNIIMAIEDAVSPQTVDLQPKPIANVINMSLGGGGGPDEPTAIASDNATLLGCSVVAAAGNSGPNEGTLGSPAAGRRVIAAAANTDPGSNANWSTDVLDPAGVNQNSTGAVTPANNLSAASTQRSQVILYPMAGTPPPPKTSEAQYYVFVRNGHTIDEWPTNVSGRIALVKITNPRVPCVTAPTLPITDPTGQVPGRECEPSLFAQIANNGAAAGAVAVLFVTSTQNPTAVRSTIPAANIGPDDATYLESLMPGWSATTDPANGAVSNFPIRLNPFFGTTFMGETAGFSSRGPVQGFGQVKPDVSAPGVNILAAVPPASVIAGLSAGANGVNYAAISGTSMATPHTSGAVALVRQAHPDWTPDMIRTALINAATNMRDENKNPKADGLTANSVLEQGGGLIDVYRTINLKALMGVTGDGISEPSILGSHSFGEVPVVNNRVSSTQSATVTIQDISGQGGTYNLAVASNRDIQLNGIGVSLSSNSVTVPAGGTATFTVNAAFDGDLIRDPNTLDVDGTTVTFRPIQMQWYVTAQGSNGQSLRMPFYFKPVPSVPATTIQTAGINGTVTAGDGDSETISGTTYVDLPFVVDANTYKLSAHLDFFQIVDGTINDLDLKLLDPDGNIVTSSTNQGGPEDLSANINRPGTYTYRVDGFLAANASFTLISKQFEGQMSAPALQPILGNYINPQGQEVDFDGSFNLQWTPAGGEQGFIIEQATADNSDWQVIATPNAGTTTYALNNLPNGQYSFRIRGVQPGQIGRYITNPCNPTGIVVDQRAKVDITNQVSQAISNVSLSSGVFQLNLALTNNSSQTYLPLLDLNVIGVNSGSGTIKVINADNGSDGKSQATAALFGYTSQLGSDQLFSPREVSGTRNLRFQDSASEMFTFDAVVTAYLGFGGSSASSGSSSASQQQSSSASNSGSLLPLNQLKAVMRFTANPLTKTVSVQLVSLK
jgi:minor extracellular serine protease Vpr